MFKAHWTKRAEATYEELKTSPSDKARYKAVKKAIDLLLNNPKHPGLQTHLFLTLTGPNGEKVFEAYAQQKTPAAYRVYWYYGPSKGDITIFAITPHP